MLRERELMRPIIEAKDQDAALDAVERLYDQGRDFDAIDSYYRAWCREHGVTS